jgi:hypothetical protein
MFLFKVYYGDKIGIRISNTNIVLFEEQMSNKEWQYLLEVAKGIEDK